MTTKGRQGHPKAYPVVTVRDKGSPRKKHMKDVWNMWGISGEYVGNVGPYVGNMWGIWGPMGERCGEYGALWGPMGPCGALWGQGGQATSKR